MPRVLLVDDDEVTRGNDERLLRANGFAVEAARSVAEAVAAVNRRVPDVVLANVQLPDADVLALVSQIHEQRASAQIPIIGATTEWTPEIRERARTAGVSAFVEKRGTPFHVLAEIYRALADRR